MDIVIRKMEPGDWKPVSEIYKQGIDTKNATFEISVPSWEEWDKSHLQKCRLIAEINHEAAGWAALSPVSSRYVYRGVAEVSVYILQSHYNKGIGTKLLRRLVEESEAAGIWTLQASVFPENTASINMHKTCGFREVGFREKIGMMDGKWRDTVLLERRSKKIENVKF